MEAALISMPASGGKRREGGRIDSGAVAGHYHMKGTI